MTAYNTRAAAGGVVVLTLAAGFLLGLVWSRTSAAQAEPTGPTVPTVPTAAAPAEEADEGRGREDRRRGLIVERVGLSAEQKVQVDSVVSHARGMMRQLRADYRTGYGELIQSTRASIKGVLTPEQATEYDTLLDDFDRRRSEGGERERESADARDRERNDRERSGRESRDGDEDERGGREWSYSF